MSARAPHVSRAGEAGSVLIEAMISAVVMLAAIAALFVVLDVQTSASSKTRASSAAAALAEQDQERLRSFSPAQLSSLPTTPRTVSVAGVAYKVESSAEWISDATGGTESCTSTGKEAQYLRLTSTVTAPAGGSTPPAPIRLRSLTASPPGRGSLTVKVTGGMGQAVVGVTATLAGPATLSAATNALGCAVFSSVPVGSYVVTASAGGFVDQSGNAVATGSATAVAGVSNITTLTYDRAASVEVAFDTKPGAAAVQAGTASVLNAANAATVPSSACAGKSETGVRRFCSTTDRQAMIAAENLFPFKDAYAFYSGSCPTANPAFNDPAYDPAYFSVPGRGSVILAPGSSTSITVREPALQLTVSTANGSTPVRVRATSIDPGCTETYAWDITTGSSSKTVELREPGLPSRVPGLPFGKYRVCAEAIVGFTRRSETIPSLALTDPAGSGKLSIDLSTTAVPPGRTAGTGVCP